MAEEDRRCRPPTAEEALAELVALRDSGQGPDFETWVRRHPELDRELRELYEGWDEVERSLETAFHGAPDPDPPHAAAPDRRASRGDTLGAYPGPA